MNALAPLLAAIDIRILVRIAVVVLIFVIPLLRQLVLKFQQIPPPDKRPLPPRPAPPDAGDEIEEFMRRAAEQHKAATGGRAANGPIIQAVPVLAEPVRAEVITEAAGEKPVGGQVSRPRPNVSERASFYPPRGANWARRLPRPISRSTSTCSRCSIIA